jgi:hypothetical protein
LTGKEEEKAQQLRYREEDFVVPLMSLGKMKDPIDPVVPDVDEVDGDVGCN